MLIEVENFKTEQVGWDDVVRQLDTIQDSTREVLQSLRQLLYELRGEESGFKLVESLNSLGRRFETKTGINVSVNVPDDWPASIAAAETLNVYRIIEEALVNVQRHSGAHSVAIVLEVLPTGMLGVTITDDGRGFDPDLRHAGMGMRGMRERAILLGGEVTINGEPGAGTSLGITFPRERVPAAVEARSLVTESNMKREEIPV